jgi:hypothetical protein
VLAEDLGLAGVREHDAVHVRGVVFSTVNTVRPDRGGAPSGLHCDELTTIRLASARRTLMRHLAPARQGSRIACAPEEHTRSGRSKSGRIPQGMRCRAVAGVS